MIYNYMYQLLHIIKIFITNDNMNKIIISYMGCKFDKNRRISLSEFGNHHCIP